jgi:hypothetical protein
LRPLYGIGTLPLEEYRPQNPAENEPEKKREYDNKNKCGGFVKGGSEHLEWL